MTKQISAHIHEFKHRDPIRLSASVRDWRESLDLEHCPDCDSHDCEHRSKFPRNNAKTVLSVSPFLAYVVTSENVILILTSPKPK